MIQPKMDRMARRLAVVLAAVLLGAVVVLGVRYRSHLLDGDGRLTLVRREYWDFGWSTLDMCFDPGGLNREWFVVGCFGWRIEYDPPLNSTRFRREQVW
jgi:hypothetical protein